MAITPFSYISVRGGKMKRRELREHIFKLLFRVEFHEAGEMPEQVGLLLEELEEAEGTDKRYIREKYDKIMKILPEIDEKLSEVSEGWKIERIGKAELSILRLAIYEVLYDEDIPPNVAINEAVELAKKFGGGEAPAYINAVLAKLV